jgi:hypothetical protein
MRCPDTPTPEARTSEVHPGGSGAEAPEALDVGAPASPTCVSGELRSEFTALFRQTVSAEYSYFYQQVGNIKHAEDLTATTFSKALASFERYQMTRGSRCPRCKCCQRIVQWQSSMP